MGKTSDIADFIRDALADYSESRILRRLAISNGIDYSSLWEYRAGVRIPSLPMAERVLEALGYTIVIKRRPA